MRRLTYAPKAYVFVRSRNHQNKVFDLTDYVVEGKVDRLVNQKSTASVVLRNNFFQFSPDRKDSFFLPMDGITIWLQRLKNKPIQVFTGYLDSVPYLQLYPGNCQITASCTLKRLEHTYFDPTIQATMDFFVSFGWVPDGSGSYTNPNSNIVAGVDARGVPITQGSPGFTTDGVSNDAGIGTMIKPFLVDIAGWNPAQVFVADLPTDLPKKAAKLYDTISSENQSMLDGLETMLKGVMTLSADDSAASSQTVVQLAVVNKIYDAAGVGNIDPAVMVTAALVLSGMDTSYIGPNGEAGLYAAKNDKATTKSQNTNRNPGLDTYSTDDFFATPYDSSHASYGGKTAKEMTNPATSTALFAHKLALADPDKTLRKQAGKGSTMAITEWIAKAAGIEPQKIATKVINQYNTAKRLVSAYSGAKIGKNDPLLTTGTGNQIPAALKWSDTAAMFSQFSMQDLDTFKKSYSKANDSLAPYAYVAHKSGLRLVAPPTILKGRNDIICLQDMTPAQEKSSLTKQFFNWAKTQPGADVVRYEQPVKSVMLGGPSNVDDSDTEYHKGSAVRGAQQQTDWPAGYVYVQVSKVAPYPKWTGNPDTSAAQNNSVPPGSPDDPHGTAGTRPVTFEDVATMGLQSAFYAQTSFPGNQALSNLLQGDKALMNDIPVMEGIKQFCGGSMRNFMSLPDGSFCAFYPDYFGGSNRKPYWVITDLEIINMGIQLSDQALATHVYVTGAVTNNPGLFNELIESVNTLGVVTLQHVFGDGNFISGDIKGNTSGDILGREVQAYQFLKFYGARPLSVQQPLIRNQMFEFLYAWQLFMYMWAAQFQTTCEFTFQPEMLAGGRVAFPDHGLEMYIESVHHTWSYESGFYTTAVLQAPTTTVKDPNNENYRPGMALAGNNLGGIGGVGG